MVGRGPVQLMYPSNHGHDYSNQTPSKMESFDIPNIKQEQIGFITPTPTVSQGDKYTQFLFGGSSSYQVVPQFLPQETGIYLLPIEQTSNNPYKQQQDTDEGHSMMFQKFPNSSDYQNLSSSSANFMPSFLPPYNKEKSLEKEDDFLAQLLDVGGFENDMYIPSSDMFIPLQSESPPQTNCFSTQSSPMQFMSSQYDGPFISEGEDISGAPGTSPVLLGEESDPLVSDVNEVTLSPSNEMLPLSNEIPQPTDDLQDILGELFGEDNFSLSNSFGQSYSPDVNIIPISTSFLNTVDVTDDETNRKPIQAVEEDIIIPSFDSPPTTKKPRMSDSSSTSMEDIPRAMDIPVPPDRPKRRFNTSSFPTNPSTYSSSQDAPTNASPKAHTPGSSTLLFGQHEDDIIHKLLTPQDRKGTKPITRDKLVTMAVEEFNTVLDEGSLTEIEVAFMKEWRRRGKNKMAAQIARKRKREELYVLEDDMDTLHQKRAQLQQSVDNLKIHIASYKRRAEAAERKIYKHYSNAHGSLVSEKTHTIHVTDDDKTMLIPRMSTQILIV